MTVSTILPSAYYSFTSQHVNADRSRNPPRTFRLISTSPTYTGIWGDTPKTAEIPHALCNVCNWRPHNQTVSGPGMQTLICLSVKPAFWTHAASNSWGRTGKRMWNREQGQRSLNMIELKVGWESDGWYTGNVSKGFYINNKEIQSPYSFWNAFFIDQ